MHNEERRIIVVFDEGSAIPEIIYETTEWALTDAYIAARERAELLHGCNNRPVRCVAAAVDNSGGHSCRKNQCAFLGWTR
jgi:hypothetical protein